MSREAMRTTLVVVLLFVGFGFMQCAHDERALACIEAGGDPRWCIKEMR